MYKIKERLNKVMTMTNKTLVFDMDGTIADLYQGEWLEKLINESTEPYEYAGKLMEENIRILDCLADRIKRDPSRTIGYTRQQLTILIRLYIGGRALLKDIARREQVPTPNLCMLFRKLEKDGLVIRDIDEKDRRNTWYDLSPHGLPCGLFLTV